MFDPFRGKKKWCVFPKFWVWKSIIISLQYLEFRCFPLRRDDILLSSPAPPKRHKRRITFEVALRSRGLRRRGVGIRLRCDFLLFRKECLDNLIIFLCHFSRCFLWYCFARTDGLPSSISEAVDNCGERWGVIFFIFPLCFKKYAMSLINCVFL